MPKYLEDSVYNELKQKIENIVKEYNEQNNTDIRLTRVRNPLYYNQLDCYSRSLLPDFKQYVIDFMLAHIPEHGSNPEHELIITQLSDKIYNLQEYFKKLGNHDAELNVHQSYSMAMLDMHIRLSCIRDQTLNQHELNKINAIDSHMTEKYSKEIELMNIK